jgi:hypothetical protein
VSTVYNYFITSEEPWNFPFKYTANLATLTWSIYLAVLCVIVIN